MEFLHPLGYTTIRLLNRTVNFPYLPRLTFLTIRFNNRIVVYPSGCKNSTRKKFDYSKKRTYEKYQVDLVEFAIILNI